MKMKKNLYLAVSLVLCFQVLYLTGVGAQEKEYPEKPIQFLVGFNPGSFSDLCARALSKVAPKYLKRPLVVVNMPGAGQTVALNELAKSAPDGYTIGTMVNDYRSVTIHQQKVPFDPKVLKPLLGFTEFRMVLSVRGDAPFTRLEDFIAYGQKNPEAITFGHAGRGLIPHLMGELFFRSANIKAIDVPYMGATIQGVIGGHVTSAITDTYGLKQQVSAGTLKILVVFLDRRHKDFPEIPTSQEKGYADLSALNPLLSVAIHKDTRPDRANKLHDVLKKVTEDPEFTKILDDMNIKCGYTSPEAVEESISKMEKGAVPLLKELRLFVQ